MSRFCKAAAAALLLLFFMAGPAAAHPILTGSEPADGQTLATAPDRLLLEFSEPVLVSSVRLSLHPSAGATRDLTASAETAERFVAPLPHLGDDVYEVRWAAISSEDGHALSGSLVFGVRRAVAAAARGDSGGPQPRDSALALARVVGASLAVGGFLVAALLVPLARRRRPSGPWPLVTRRALWVASIGAGIGLLAVLAIAVASSAWQFAAAAHGRRLIEQLALLLTALVISRRTLATDRGPITAGPVTAGLVAAALAVGVGALDGHAAAAGEAVAAAAHAVAAAVWIGGVIALVVAGRPLLADGTSSSFHPTASRKRSAGALLGAYALPAVVSVVTLAVTGPVLAGRQIATPHAAMATPYGLILVTKLLILGGVAAIAIHSARGRSGGRLLIVEAVLLGGVACCAAVLTVTPPARGPGLDPAPAAVPLQRSVRLDDLVLEVAVRPGTPGRNLVTVEIHDTRRPRPGPVSAVRLGLAGSSVAAVSVAERRWQAVADLPPAGGVPIQIDVARNGLPTTGTKLDWTVRGDVPRGPLADQPLAPITNAAALAFAAAGAVLALVWRRRRHSEDPDNRTGPAADPARARTGA
ncbi:copper resistance protein CopC [Nonomuraea sp. M3C6]|uniref:Copper resistance protein CopC n=1 Tax=Nonomuraea marmarensis TaxID=3351344 RepID=A0ABW7AQN4_9ACTN